MTVDVLDRFASARAVADAVLYEGYMLYPYRASSTKNQVRWQFGVLTPRAFSEAEGSERWSIRTECVAEAGAEPGAEPGVASRLSVRLRCLRIQRRTVEAPSSSDAGPAGGFVPVESLLVDGQRYVPWEEAVEEVVDLGPLRLWAGDPPICEEAFAFSEGRDVEVLRGSDGALAGRLVRCRERVEGRIRVVVEAGGDHGRLAKISVTVENRTAWSGSAQYRAEALGRSLIAVHTMLAVDGGTFVSLLDAPAHAQVIVESCQQDGGYPVLIGDDDVVLSSPIILYDHPEVAPESPGNLYDATEIDEILALRVLTMTDEEKSEARGTDARSAAIIDRCDGMPPEVWERLHGGIREIRAAGRPAATPRPEPAPDPGAGGEEGAPAPAWWDPGVDAAADPWTDTVVIAGSEVGKGAAVRLRPSHRADAQDLFLGGLEATVAGVFTDVDGGTQVAVTVDSDPATVELAWQGRYLFFHPDEVEPLTRSADR